MKRDMKYMAILSVVCLMAACAKENVPVSPQDESVNGQEISADSEKGFVKFYASKDGEGLKSDLNLDTKVVPWTEGDEIAIAYEGCEAPVKFTATEVNGSSATFESETMIELDKTYFAFYPYDAVTGFTGDSFNAVFPADQVIAEGNTAASEALLAVGSTTDPGSLPFKNAFSVVSVTVPEGISSVAVEGIYDGALLSEPLAGNVNVTAGDNPVVSFSEGRPVTSVEAKVPGAGTYAIAVAPQTLANGIRCYFKKDGSTISAASKAITEAVTLPRNGGLIGPSVSSLDDLNFNKSYIRTSEEMQAWRESVKVNTVLGADIDMSGAEWTSVHFKPASAASFDGQNHSIYNIVCSNTDANAGFINNLGDGTNSATLKNVVFGSNDYNPATGTGTADGASSISLNDTKAVSDKWFYAGPVSYVHINSTIDNVINYIPVTVQNTAENKHRAGGISGTMKAGVEIRNCVNYADVTDNGQSTNDYSDAAGISGALDGIGGKITGCRNYGNIVCNSEKMHSVAGIVGYVIYGFTISSCENHGDVTYNSNTKLTALYLGGITGLIKGLGTDVYGKILECSNFGKVENKGTVPAATGDPGYSIKVGGVAAHTVARVTVEKCHNYGIVKNSVSVNKNNKASIGGIVGNTAAGSLVTYCVNHKDNTLGSGTVTLGASTRDTALGGIVGYGKGPIANCTNEADVYPGQNLEAASFVGGIAGYLNDKTATITGCSNSGHIYQTTAQKSKTAIDMGGIVGQVKAAVTSCTNSGVVEYKILIEDATNRIGGIVGRITCPDASEIKISACSNASTATVGYSGNSVSTKSYAGGIAGYVYNSTTSSGAVSFDKCANKGTVKYKTKSNNLGGIVGGSGTDPETEAKISLTVKNCLNSGSMSTMGTNSSFCGGIVGYGDATVTLLMQNCDMIGTMSTDDKGYIAALACKGFSTDTEIKDCCVTSAFTTTCGSDTYNGKALISCSLPKGYKYASAKVAGTFKYKTSSKNVVISSENYTDSSLQFGSSYSNTSPAVKSISFNASDEINNGDLLAD